MAIARQHAVAGAEIFFDGLRLGGRFNDDEFQVDAFLYVRTRDCRVMDSGSSSGQADLAAGVPLQPAAKLQFEEDQLNRARRSLGKPDDLVDRHR